MINPNKNVYLAKADIIIIIINISSKCNLFSALNSWKIDPFALNNNHSLNFLSKSSSAPPAYIFFYFIFSAVWSTNEEVNIWCLLVGAGYLCHIYISDSSRTYICSGLFLFKVSIENKLLIWYKWSNRYWVHKIVIKDHFIFHLTGAFVVVIVW